MSEAVKTDGKASAIFKNKAMEPVDRERWLANQADIVKQKFISKYQAGQLEHGGDLGAVSTEQLLNEMEQEALDQLAFVREMKRRQIL